MSGGDNVTMISLPLRCHIILTLQQLFDNMRSIPLLNIGFWLWQLVAVVQGWIQCSKEDGGGHCPDRSTCCPTETPGVSACISTKHQDPEGKKIISELLIDRFVNPQDEWYDSIRKINLKLASLEKDSNVTTQP